MTCHQEILLDLNSDCAEFCTDEHHYNLLAVGTYQLDEASTKRNGRLYLYSLHAAEEQDGPQLQQLASLNVPGIFDLQWAHLPRSSDEPCIGLALADGTLRIVAVQQKQEAADTDPSAADDATTSHAAHGQLRGDSAAVTGLQELFCCQAVADSMALFLDWHPQQPNTAAISSSAGTLSIVQVIL